MRILLFYVHSLFLRSIAKEINSEKIFFLAVIYFLLGYFVSLFELLLFNNQYHLNTHLSDAFICTDLFFLPILGFYIENKMDMERVSLGKLSLLWISNVLLLLLAAYTTSLVNANGANIVKQTYIGCFFIRNSICSICHYKEIASNKTM